GNYCTGFRFARPTMAPGASSERCFCARREVSYQYLFHISLRYHINDIPAFLLPQQPVIIREEAAFLIGNPILQPAHGAPAHRARTWLRPRRRNWLRIAHLRRTSGLIP